jgi:hypothetical protein
MDSSNVIPIKQNRIETFNGILYAYKERTKFIEAFDNVLILNLEESNVFNITLRKSMINISFDKLPDPSLTYSCTLVFKQDTMGNRKVIFPENVLWSCGETAILSTKPGFVDVVTMMTSDGGETYYASHALAHLGKK